MNITFLLKFMLYIRSGRARNTYDDLRYNYQYILLNGNIKEITPAFGKMLILVYTEIIGYFFLHISPDENGE